MPLASFDPASATEASRRADQFGQSIQPARACTAATVRPSWAKDDNSAGEGGERTKQESAMDREWLLGIADELEGMEVEALEDKPQDFGHAFTLGHVMQHAKDVAARIRLYVVNRTEGVL